MLNRVASIKSIGKVHNRELVGYSEVANNAIDSYVEGEGVNIPKTIPYWFLKNEGKL